MEDFIKENDRRNAALAAPYDQLTGIGCCGLRTAVGPSDFNDGRVMVPVSMIHDDAYQKIASCEDWVRLRCRHDFEYWAVTCATIAMKTTGRLTEFRLNRPQRRVLAIMEQMRTDGKPIRLIMLKARQWGGSTLIQLYMAWLQTVVYEHCNSLICAHVKDAASKIRGIYTRLLESYPEQYGWSEKRSRFRPFEGSRDVRLIVGRDCTVTIASSESPEAVRGADYALAHLSEVAYWADTLMTTPEDLITAVCGAIDAVPGTLIVMESTANGVGNYFHREWQRSLKGESDKTPVFVGWFENDSYRVEVKDPLKLWQSMDSYEKMLWQKGLTLEQIAWYRLKRREYVSVAGMNAEYPTTPVEAFVSTGSNVFSPDKIDLLRRDCREPAAIGELSLCNGMLFFTDDDKGDLKVWTPPVSDRTVITDRYVVAVDIGGRSPKSDYSVIAVFDRGAVAAGGKVEVVAQWRGHADHDLVAGKAVEIARWYRDALLVIESNTFETDNIGGDPALSVLSQISDSYRNLYYRQTADGSGARAGFHTNRATKTLIINKLIASVRDAAYVERDDEACNEMAVYEQRAGSFAASSGNHDDIVMTRAMGLFVISTLPVERPGDFDIFRSRPRYVF